MRLVVVHAGREREVEVAVPDDARVADLAAALGDQRTTDLVAGGRRLPGTTLVREAGIREGETVRPVTPDDDAAPATEELLDPEPPEDVVTELHVVGGLTAGARHLLRAGTTTIGRVRSADVVVANATVSASHARLAVAADGSCTVEDLGSRNGTWVDGTRIDRPRAIAPGELLELGAVQLLLRPVRRAPTAPTTPAAGATTVAFNRPPRPAGPPPPVPVRVPATPPSPTTAAAFGWAAVLAPVVVGLAMAVLWDPRMAFFLLFSPALLLANRLEDRRRQRRGAARTRAAHQQQVAAFLHHLTATTVALRDLADAATPDPAELVTRALTTDTRLWERRHDAPDALRLRLGLGTVELGLPLDLPADPEPGLVDDARRAAWVPRTAVMCDLADGACLGVVGDRTTALPLLRWLVLAAAVEHGPADLRIAVVTDRPDAWRWARWLPHLAAPTTPGRTLLAPVGEAADALLDHLSETTVTRDGPRILLVVDAPTATQGRGAPARQLLRRGGRVSGIATTDTASQLPDVCREVVTLAGPDGRATLEHPATGARTDDLLLAGVDEALARRVSRALAGLDDPEAADATGRLPARVALTTLLGLDDVTAEAVRERWREAGRDMATPIGLTGDGPLVVDLVRDGPHGFLGGTTGSGKSELLRTLVAGLAASADPAHLTFLLIDYKGGAAFDACAELPHTVGVVTDLDEHLAARALTCLEAELRRRETHLRDAGAPDLAAYLAAGHDEPLPRLLVVIDELAALTAELPDFVDALVDVAQRGRSLGVHLLLATQRPSGVVSEPIRANTDLRLALRVQDEHDARDVVGVPDPAHLDRAQAGRGFVRLGPGAPIDFQTAQVSVVTATSGAGSVRVRPLDAEPAEAAEDAPRPTTAPTDLDRIVAACRAAAADLPAPRRPLPPPLPAELTRADLACPGRPGAADPTPTSVTIGLADEPERQRQVPLTLDLGRGATLLLGAAGSGPTDALVATALDLAERHTPDDLHLYVLDAGTGGLAALAGLPHVGAHVGPAERERRGRLIRQVRAELEDRRAAGRSRVGPRPTIVLLLDGWSAVAAALDDVASLALRDDLERIIVDGAPLGICTVLTADRPGALPAAIAGAAAGTLLFRLADAFDYAAAGVPRDRVPPAVRGRGVERATGREVQVATLGATSLSDAVSEVAARTGGPVRRPPTPVGVLPTEVKLAEILPAADLTGGSWRVALGVADDDLGPAVLALGPGDHALVAGPARSGRSTALLVVAETVAALRPDVAVTAVTPRPSPLGDLAGARIVTDLAALDEVWARLAEASGPQLVLVDDAEGVEDPAGALHRLLTARRPDLRLVAAGRVDALRGAYLPWLAEVRRTRTGVALRPNPDTDGSLWETAIARRGLPATWPAGRGVLLREGRADVVQVAVP